MLYVGVIKALYCMLYVYMLLKHYVLDVCVVITLFVIHKCIVVNIDAYLTEFKIYRQVIKGVNIKQNV